MAIQLGLSGLAAAGAVFWMVALAALLLVLFGIIAKNKDSYGEFLDSLMKTSLSQLIAEFAGWVFQIDAADGSLKKLETTVKRIVDLIKGVGEAFNQISPSMLLLGRKSFFFREGQVAPQQAPLPVPSPGQSTTINNGANRTANITINAGGNATAEDIALTIRRIFDDEFRVAESDLIPEAIE